jgi:ribosomal protein S18 acetylase RimI-like enzyme
MAVASGFPRRETAGTSVSDRFAGLLSAHRLALRHPTDTDWPFLYDLFASLRADEMARISWSPDRKDAFLREQFRLQHHHFVSYFAAADFWIVERSLRSGPNFPVGRLYLDRSQSRWLIVDIGFLPEARGQGLGTALLKWVQASASDAGAAAVDLHVMVTNVGAEKLYRSLGFRNEGSAEGYHQLMVWDAAAQLNTA